MQIEFMQMLQWAGAFVAGGLIGLGFGQLQQLAAQRYEAQEKAGQFHSGWAVMPRSFGRVGFLLVALVLVQLVCPLLFTDGGQWWVSGGVLSGYAVILARQLKQRAHRRAVCEAWRK